MVNSSQTPPTPWAFKSTRRLHERVSLTYRITPSPGRSFLSVLNGGITFSIRITWLFTVGFSQLSESIRMSQDVASPRIKSIFGRMLFIFRWRMLRWLARESNHVEERISLVSALPSTEYGPSFSSMSPLRSINKNSYETRTATWNSMSVRHIKEMFLLVWRSRLEVLMFLYISMHCCKWSTKL